MVNILSATREKIIKLCHFSFFFWLMRMYIYWVYGNVSEIKDREGGCIRKEKSNVGSLLSVNRDYSSEVVLICKRRHFIHLPRITGDAFIA